MHSPSLRVWKHVEKYAMMLECQEEEGHVRAKRTVANGIVARYSGAGTRVLVTPTLLIHYISGFS